MAELGDGLSTRELEVLKAVADGLANKEIAVALSISHNTVKVHLRNIYTKLGAASRTEATMVAIQQGLMKLPGAEADDPIADEGDQPDESPPPNGADLVGATAVAPLQPTRRPFLNRTEIALILVTLVMVLLIGLYGWRAITGAATPEPEPFAEEPIGESRWMTNNRPMPQERAGMAVAAIGLELYGIGGETAVSIVNSVIVYNTSSHVWREAAAKPTAVSDITAAVLFGEIYVPGGLLTDRQATDVVEVYSPANDAWRPAAALPQPVAGGLTLTDGSFVYLFGGWDGEQYLDTVFVYDPAADDWETLSPMVQPRAYAAGEMVAGQLFVVGGYDGRSELSLCQSYDPEADAWTDCPGMKLPRAGAGAATLLNRLYILGGGLDDSGEVTYSEVYDPASQEWQEVNTPALSESLAWTRLGVANIETRIFALGGIRGRALSAETLVYAPFVYQTFIPAAASGDGQ